MLLVAHEEVPLDRLAPGFRNLVWGYIVVLVDVTINDFDLLFDPIGYLILFATLSRFRGVCSEAVVARGLVAGLGALSVVMLFSEVDVAVAWPGFDSVLTWILLGFVVDLGVPALTDEARRARNLLLGFLLATAFLPYLATEHSLQLMTFLAYVLIVCVLVATFLVLRSLWHATDYAEDQDRAAAI